MKLSYLLLVVTSAFRSCSASAEPQPEPVSTTADCANPFKHPGVVISSGELAFIKAKVAEGAPLWTSALADLEAHPLASMTRQPKPFATVECGPTSTPNIGCYEEREDALAAYSMSLLWVITGVPDYAAKAISYMNAWAQTLKAHTNSNAKLQTGWAGAVWPRAAEIIRYSGAGWSRKDIAAFSTMLKNIYQPIVLPGVPNQNGNWELVMMEAAIGISVFLNNRTSYDLAMAKFLQRVPAYIYLKSDGRLPKTSPEDKLNSTSKIVQYWQGLSNFSVDGLSQETCRDLNHTGYGFESIAHVAATSRIQGRNLFAEDTGARLRAGYELHSGYEANPSTIPSWLCGGKLEWNLGPTTEVAYNGLATRLGYDMPNTLTITLKNRPAEYGTNNALFYIAETLTHADNLG